MSTITQKKDINFKEVVASKKVRKDFEVFGDIKCRNQETYMIFFFFFGKNTHLEYYPHIKVKLMLLRTPT